MSEKTTKEAAPKHMSARVSSDVLRRLAPMLAPEGEFTRMSLRGWRVEPLGAEGVLVVATNGYVFGAMRDPKGRASGPMTIFPSKGLLEAIKPPKPITVYYPGDWDEEPLPDKFMPGDVYAWSLGVHVFDRTPDADRGEESEGRSLWSEMAEDGNVWRGGFRLLDDYVPWRRAFKAWTRDEATTSDFRLSPSLFALFSEIDTGTLELSAPEDHASPVLVRCARLPDFVGLIMRGSMTVHPPPPMEIPEWIGLDTEAVPELAPSS